jgi:hypothetical protein
VDILSGQAWEWGRVFLVSQNGIVLFHNRIGQKTMSQVGYSQLRLDKVAVLFGMLTTPLLILETAINNPDMSQMLVTIFNDKDPNVAKNYKDVLLQLEVEGKILANPPAKDRCTGTFADGVIVTFPKYE